MKAFEFIAKAFEFIAEVDEQHKVQFALPESIAPGKVRILVLAPEADEDEAGLSGCRESPANGPKN